MMGVELFGAAPPFPLHKASVLRTPARQVERGLPRYGIVGVAVSEKDSKEPDYNLRLLLLALFGAVDAFNASNSDGILRVGLLPEDLALQQLDAETAISIIREVYEQHYASVAQ